MCICVDVKQKGNPTPSLLPLSPPLPFCKWHLLFSTFTTTPSHSQILPPFPLPVFCFSSVRTMVYLASFPSQLPLLHTPYHYNHPPSTCCICVYDRKCLVACYYLGLCMELMCSMKCVWMFLCVCWYWCVHGVCWIRQMYLKVCVCFYVLGVCKIYT